MISFWFKIENANITIENPFLSAKSSIKTLVEEIQAVVLQLNEFDYQETSLCPIVLVKLICHIIKV